MVPRYSRPAMTALWEPEARFKIWFEIEAHATEKLGELGVVPESAAKALWDWWATDPKIDVEAIDAIEAVTKHDVIAFLTWVAENVGDEARFMHQGMTSSDVLDTTLAVQLMRSADILLADLDALLVVVPIQGQVKPLAHEDVHIPNPLCRQVVDAAAQLDAEPADDDGHCAVSAAPLAIVEVAHAHKPRV